MTNASLLRTDKEWTRLKTKKCNQVVPGDRIIIIVIIIIITTIFINCNWVVIRWQWLIYVCTKYEIGY